MKKAPVKVVEIMIPDKPEPEPQAASVSEIVSQDPIPPKKKVGRIILGIAAMIGAAALLIGAGALTLRLQPLSRVYSLIVSSPSFIFRVGDENSLSYYFKQETDIPLLLRLQEDKKERVSFQSSDESVVTVDSGGHLNAVGAGSADVTVSVEDLSEVIHVTSYRRGSSLVFDQPECALNSGEETDLSASLVPSDALLVEDIRYSVTDGTIIEIDANGHLRALAPGEAEVIAETENLQVRAKVSVYEPMTGIALALKGEDQALQVERGGRLSFPVRFFPDNTTDPKNVTYSISDPSIGSLSENGVFTAEAPGRTTLTAECNGFTDSIEIEVQVTLLGVRLNRTETTLLYQQQDQLVLEVFPEDTTDDLEPNFVSDNPGAVTVDGNGLVKAVGPGTATITAYVNGYTAHCVYHVHVPVTAVNISTGRLTLNKGQGAKLAAAVYPSFATEDRSITWRSDNPNVVSVDANGNIKALNGGSARIYAIHGKYSNSCLVVVNVPVTRDVIANRIINFGKQFLGTRYVYGGNSLTGGIDCSSFTMQCFASVGIGLPRVSYQQVQCGRALPMDPSQWLPGDLLFYSPGGYVSHVAIYIGNGQIIQSAHSMGGVCITSYNYNGYTPSHARRIF